MLIDDLLGTLSFKSLFLLAERAIGVGRIWLVLEARFLSKQLPQQVCISSEKGGDLGSGEPWSPLIFLHLQASGSPAIQSPGVPCAPCPVNVWRIGLLLELVLSCSALPELGTLSGGIMRSSWGITYAMSGSTVIPPPPKTSTF